MKYTFSNESGSMVVTVLKEYKNGYAVKVNCIVKGTESVYPLIIISKDGFSSCTKLCSAEETETPEWEEPKDWDRTFFESDFFSTLQVNAIFSAMFNTYKIIDGIYYIIPIYPKVKNNTELR